PAAAGGGTGAAHRGALVQRRDVRGTGGRRRGVRTDDLDRRGGPGGCGAVPPPRPHRRACRRQDRGGAVTHPTPTPTPTVTAAANSTSDTRTDAPGRSPRWRRVGRVLLGVAVLVVALVMWFVGQLVISPSADNGPGDTDPGGYAALAALLRDEGID